MGKSQKKKAMRRHNPMRVPDSHLPKGLSAAASSSSKTGDILPIIQKMQSADAAERKWACVAVSNLIQNDPSTRRLLQGKNVVGALITRLTDSEEEVIVEAMGALRNLCVDGGFDICAEMYNKNILVPLATFVTKISTALSQFLQTPKSASENVERLVYEFADNVITCLWCLSETSNKALNAINQMRLVPFLMSFLGSREHLPLSTTTTAAQSLYVLTDDNPPAINDVRSNLEYIKCLLSVAQHSEQRNGDVKVNGKQGTDSLKVLVAGVLRNISPLPQFAPITTEEVDKEVILPLLRRVVSSLSLEQMCSAAQELITRENAEPQFEKLSLKNTPKSDHRSPSEIELTHIEESLRTVGLALEILTGLCVTLPDPEPEIPEENGGADEDETSSEDDMAIDDEANDSRIKSKGHGFLTTLVRPLLPLIQPTALSFPPCGGPSPHPPTTTAFGIVHVRAFECLNNIFLSLSTYPDPAVITDAEAGIDVWNKVWLALTVVGTQFGLGQEMRESIWEVAAGVLWGIGNVWKGQIESNEEQIRMLTQLCDGASDPSLRVKCIGALECIAQSPKSIEANKAISNYLVSVLPEGTSPSPAGTEPLIQAVSAMIDIYSDETSPCDVNFREGNFLERLSLSVEGVKKAVKAIDRKKEGGRELKRRGEEVYENLVAFIRYRKDLGP